MGGDAGARAQRFRSRRAHGHARTCGSCPRRGCRLGGGSLPRGTPGRLLPDPTPASPQDTGNPPDCWTCDAHPQPSAITRDVLGRVQAQHLLAACSGSGVLLTGGSTARPPRRPPSASGRGSAAAHNRHAVRSVSTPLPLAAACAGRRCACTRAFRGPDAVSGPPPPPPPPPPPGTPRERTWGPGPIARLLRSGMLWLLSQRQSSRTAPAMVWSRAVPLAPDASGPSLAPFCSSRLPFLGTLSRTGRTDGE